MTQPARTTCTNKPVCSVDDRLCDVVELEKLIAEKRRRGQRVEAVRWEQSQHVTHLRLHTAEYRSAVLRWLDAAQREPLAPSKL